MAVNGGGDIRVKLWGRPGDVARGDLAGGGKRCEKIVVNDRPSGRAERTIGGLCRRLFDRPPWLAWRVEKSPLAAWHRRHEPFKVAGHDPDAEEIGRAERQG